jgi:radical SAM protein with 4Fe4S-binding SPASM domain
VTPQNIARLATCLDELSAAGLLENPLVRFYFFPILDIRGVCSGRGFSCLKRYYNRELLMQLWQLAAARGSRIFERPSPVWIEHFCSFVNKGAWVVDPSGSKFKCVAAVGDPDEICGSVMPVSDRSLARLYQQRADAFMARSGRNLIQCQACEFLPSCDGGCSYLAKVASGGLMNPECDTHGIVSLDMLHFLTDHLGTDREPEECVDTVSI